MNTKRLLVVGGGAAGLAAAICAARKGARVTVLEKLDRVGKKILATGNGRCNIINAGALRYHGDAAFAQKVLEKVDTKKVTAFFEGLGLSLRQEEEGRVYPASGMASSVLDVLRLGCNRYGVETICGAPVHRIERLPNGWAAIVGDKRYAGNALIITGGGKASPKLGSDGSAYALLQSLGHTLVAPKPAITQIKTELEPIRGLSGIRVKAEISLAKGGNTVGLEQGEILFTEYGISGVAAMQLSRDAAGGVLHVGLAPAMNVCEESLPALFQSRAALFGDALLEQFFLGLTHSRLGMAIFKRAGIGPLSRPCASLSMKEISALCAVVRDFSLHVTGVQGYENAQVTAGGMDTRDFDPATMASHLHKGLYAAGEVLNVDGACGGYNLLFAWAGGMLAGESAADFSAAMDKR